MPAFEVGDRVQAIYEDNAAGKSFPGHVVRVTTEAAHTSWASRNFYGERGILLFYLLCCCFCHKGKRFYDIDYEDGRHEKKVPESRVSAAAT
mmetsp:Transcript_102392/g.285242  ORF Transcript_102392/g.285242 Transcript_102392/m.285242 type:complete len:92 (+) Transcript_102392:239-514(+)